MTEAMPGLRTVWLLPAVLAVVLLLGAPAGIGWLAERLLPPRAEIATGAGDLRWQLVEFRRGWFTSTAVSRLVIETDQSSRTLDLTHQVRHWPSSFDSLAHFDTQTPAEAEAMGAARTEMLWSGATRTRVALSAGRLPWPGASKWVVEPSAGTAELRTRPDGQAALGLSWPEVVAAGPAGTLQLRALDLKFDGNGSAGSATIQAAAQALAWTPEEDAGLQLERLALDLALARDVDGLLGGEGKLAFDALQVSEKAAGPGEIGLAAERLDPQLIARLARLYASGRTDGLNWVLAGLALAQQRPAIRIDPLSIDTADGPVEGRLEALVRDPGPGRLVLDPNLLTLELDLATPEPFARALVAATLAGASSAEGSQTGSSAAQALLQRLERMGWISRLPDGRMALSLGFRDGSFRRQSQPLPADKP
ncbi:MAG: DUF945 family protein [Halothiobacillaceae bacterium]